MVLLPGSVFRHGRDSPSGGQASTPEAAVEQLPTRTSSAGTRKVQEHSVLQAWSDGPATKSVEDLLSGGPKLDERHGICHTYFCAHLKRVNTVYIDEVLLLPREREALVNKAGLGFRASQYLAWRSSLLHTGTFFFAIIVALDVQSTLGSSSSTSVLLQKVDDRYDAYFAGLVRCDLANSIGLLVASALAVILAAYASFHWQQFQRSAFAVLASFLCSYLPPFFLLLLIPFRSGIDFKGVQQQMCRDVVAGVVTQSGLWPRLGTLGLGSLLDAYSVRLSPGFCEQPPSEWGAALSAQLQGAGLLLDDRGSCPRAELGLQGLQAAANESGVAAAAADLAQVAATAVAHCPTACANCTGACTPQLVPLSALAGLVGAGAMEAQLPPDGPLAACAHCVSTAPGLQCPWRCPNVSAALSRQALAGRLPPAAAACIAPGELRDFQLLARLGTQTTYWQILLGSAYALLSFLQLMPLTLSLLFGAAKGSGIAKSVIPYSRLPGVVSCAAAIFTFPFICQLAVVIQSTIGNLLTLFGLLLVLLANIMNMKPGLLRARSHHELHAWSDVAGNVAKLCIVVSLILFAVAIGTSDLLRTTYKLACEDFACLSALDLSKAKDFFASLGVQLVAAFLGKSLISTVFFADGAVSLMYHFHHREMRDPLEIQCARARLVSDLHTMWRVPAPSGNDTGGDDVAPPEDDPDDEPRAVVSLAQLVAVQRMLRRLKERADLEEQGEVDGDGEGDGKLRTGVVASSTVKDIMGDIAALFGATAVAVGQQVPPSARLAGLLQPPGGGKGGAETAVGPEERWPRLSALPGAMRGALRAPPGVTALGAAARRAVAAAATVAASPARGGTAEGGSPAAARRQHPGGP